MKSILFVILFTIVLSCPIQAEEITLPCEVIESSASIDIPNSILYGIRYTLIHQANAADRAFFSEWLKANTDSRVTFTIDGRTYDAVLSRISNCFGRGLLIHNAETRIDKRAIMDLTLPESETVD